MQDKQEILSLFDYLGYAAGSELGKQVADYAKIRKTRCNARYVSNPKYKGNIMLYTKEFLDEYFQVKKIFTEPDYTEINTQLTEESFKLVEQENQNKIF
jgi:hypothetical protein